MRHATRKIASSRGDLEPLEHGSLSQRESAQIRMSIGSAVFAGLMNVTNRHTDIQSDHATPFFLRSSVVCLYFCWSRLWPKNIQTDHATPSVVMSHIKLLLRGGLVKIIYYYNNSNNDNDNNYTWSLRLQFLHVLFYTKLTKRRFVAAAFQSDAFWRWLNEKVSDKFWLWISCHRNIKYEKIFTHFNVLVKKQSINDN